jgi:uncharacterized protein (DUF1501 family)
MAITRRQFLQRTGAATAGTLLVPGIFGNTFVRKALADTIGDRYLVILFLDGGNDGLNTVIPMSNGSHTHRDDYTGHRKSNGGGIQISTGDLSATTIGTDPLTGAQLGIHPGLAGLMPAWNANQLAVIQGVGYPDYNLSHDTSRSIWQTGNPLGVGAYTGSGWAGRHLAANYLPNQVPGVTISSGVAPEYRQTATSVLAIERLNDFGFPYDDYYLADTPAERDAKDAAFQTIYGVAAGGTQAAAQYIGNSGNATLSSTTAYGTLHDSYITDRAAFDAAYEGLGNGTANDFREIAKIIYGVKNGVANVNARFFQASHGGFDTHSNQGGAETDGQHYGIHDQWSQAVNTFRQDLEDMGVWNKTTVVVWSEFSRRIPQNDNGTDHGSQGPVFVIGGGVTGGVYGNHPNIQTGALDGDENTVYSQAAGDFRSTDMRDVYGTILKHWLNMPVGQITSTILPVDGGDPNLFWTNPNFDMGFLA